MRSNGTTVHARRWLAAILRAFPGESHLYFVEHQGETLAGALCLTFGGTLLPFYAGTHRDHRRRGVDDFLYWSLLRWGIDNGFHTFDFGRSKRGSGAWRFKSRWGMQEVPLGYQYHLVRARQMPDLSPRNARYQALIATWRRLPLLVTRLLGPPLVRRIP